MTAAKAGGETIHASCVAWQGRAVLILGPAGSGKSALALQLMAMGCALVADDRTVLRREGAELVASAPERLRGRIEARGLGILGAEAVAAARVVLAADLGEVERARLPAERRRDLLGLAVPFVHRVESAHFPAAVLQYLKGGRQE